MNDTDFKGLLSSVQEMIDDSKGKITLNSRTIEVTPLPEYSQNEVRSLRENLGMSRPIFGEILGVSSKTVESWERGVNHPTGPTRRLFQILEKTGSSNFIVSP